MDIVVWTNKCRRRDEIDNATAKLPQWPLCSIWVIFHHTVLSVNGGTTLKPLLVTAGHKLDTASGDHTFSKYHSEMTGGHNSILPSVPVWAPAQVFSGSRHSLHSSFSHCPVFFPTPDSVCRTSSAVSDPGTQDKTTCHSKHRHRWK